MSSGHAHDDALPWRPMAARAGVCAVSTLVAWRMESTGPIASQALYGLALFSGSWDLARHVARDLRALRFNTEFLMLLVVVGSTVLGTWSEGALLLVLFSSSSALGAFASARTRREIQALLKGVPKQARLLVDGVETQVSVDSLRPGQEIRLTANEQVPVDLIVLRGDSACDESTLTGEAEPVSKSAGDRLSAGTLNLWGVLECRVECPAGESALQRIIQMIHDAQQQKAPIQRFTDRFGTRYTVGVVVGCGVWFLYNHLGRGMPAFSAPVEGETAFYRAMTLLVVLSPCALVLSVPSAILSAIACGARRGVLFRGGAAVETLADITAVAMDKTGTLTEGTLQLVGIESLEGDEAAALAAAGSLAALSNHPISRSLQRETIRRGAGTVPLSGSETVPGQGIRARGVDGDYALGSRALLGARLPRDLFETLPAVPDGVNETWVCGPGLLARLLLRDALRPESAGLVARLKSDGLRTVMLTGDRAAAAERLAREVGVDEVIPQLRPEEKVASVRSLRDQGYRVAMIGDGVNDAPVIAGADVGVAMGIRGSDAALEQADVVLMNDRLENFLFARDLSRRSRRIIGQNLVISLGTMAVMALATLGWSGLPLWTGVAAHEGSTVLVVLNSLRLLASPRSSADRKPGL
ncbi:MAG: cation-translocating P-type ATPase [Verrucomicrobia bacterium]|nr:cation-translocating P-type ATPase [Verrucomicrobiota bacterium]